MNKIRLAGTLTFINIVSGAEGEKKIHNIFCPKSLHMQQHFDLYRNRQINFHRALNTTV